MKPVTIEDCQAVVNEHSLKPVCLRSCSGCGAPVMFEFAIAKEAFPHPQSVGLKPDDLIVGFDGFCDCTSIDSGIELRSWESFAEIFNRQTPEHRAQMWERFKARKMLMP